MELLTQKMKLNLTKCSYFTKQIFGEQINSSGFFQECLSQLRWGRGPRPGTPMSGTWFSHGQGHRALNEQPQGPCRDTKPWVLRNRGRIFPMPGDFKLNGFLCSEDTIKGRARGKMTFNVFFQLWLADKIHDSSLVPSPFCGGGGRDQTLEGSVRQTPGEWEDFLQKQYCQVRWAVSGHFMVRVEASPPCRRVPASWSPDPSSKARVLVGEGVSLTLDSTTSPCLLG